MGVTSDKERIHRWITQADLERMLSDAHRKGFWEGRASLMPQTAEWTEHADEHGALEWRALWFGHRLVIREINENKYQWEIFPPGRRLSGSATSLFDAQRMANNVAGEVDGVVR